MGLSGELEFETRKFAHYIVGNDLRVIPPKI